MAQYNVQDPQGQMRIIEGPDGASDEEVISKAQELFGHSGGMPSNDPISAFKQALANHPARPNPIGGFDQDVNQAPKATDPTGQRLIENASTAGGGYGLGALGAGITAWGAGKLGAMQDVYQGAKAAEAAAPVEGALDAGLNAKGAFSSEKNAALATKNALYDVIPKDVKLPVSNLVNKVDDVINEIKDIPKVDRSSTIDKILAEYGDLKNVSVGTTQVMRSNLGELAVNGQGAERMYAARLLDALNKDMEAFGKSTLVNGMPKALSQEPTLEANALRNKWFKAAQEQNNMTNDVADTGLRYVHPEAMGNGGAPAITNSDVPANLSKANSFYKDFSDLYNHPVSQGLAKARPEEMGSVAFSRGNIDDVRVAKSVLGPVGYNSIQGQFYQKLLNTKNVGTVLAKNLPFYQEALGAKNVQNLQALAHFKDLVSKAMTAGKIGAGAIGAAGVYEGARKLAQ